VVGSCEHGDELSGFMKYEEFQDYLFKKDIVLEASHLAS
jgi:hypothetical protein